MRFPFLGLGMILLLVGCSTNRPATTDAGPPDAAGDLPGNADTQPWGAEVAVEAGPGARDAVTADAGSADAGSSDAEADTRDGPSAMDVRDAAAILDSAEDRVESVDSSRDDVPVDTRIRDARGEDSASVAIDAIALKTGSARATLSFSLMDGGATNANMTSFTSTSSQVTEGRTAGFPAYQIALVMGQRSFSITLRGELTPGTVYRPIPNTIDGTAIVDYIENQKRGWTSPYLQNPQVGTIEVIAVTSKQVDLAVRSMSLHGVAGGATGTLIVDGTIVLTW